jgi:hypothetical protein
LFSVSSRAVFHPAKSIFSNDYQATWLTYIFKPLVVMAIIVHVTMIQFFVGRLTQRDNLYIEMQFITRQRMIEVQTDSFSLDRVHAGITGLT